MKEFLFVTFNGAFGKRRMISEYKLNKYEKYCLGEVLIGRGYGEDGKLVGEKEFIPKYQWNFFLMLESKLS